MEEKLNFSEIFSQLTQVETYIYDRLTLKGTKVLRYHSNEVNKIDYVIQYK